LQFLPKRLHAKVVVLTIAKTVQDAASPQAVVLPSRWPSQYFPDSLRWIEPTMGKVLARARYGQ
jgi:hypothetical protein